MQPTWALTREWALNIRPGKTVTWALTREWALARETTVVDLTRLGKTLHMGLFLKVEFDAWLISSIIEFKSYPDCVLHCGDTALCDHATPPTTERFGLKALLNERKD